MAPAPGIGAVRSDQTEYCTMTKSAKHRIEETVRSKSKGNFSVLGKIGGAHIKAALVAAIVLGVAYAVTTRAILTLESSQDLFEVMD
jgi:hypothetical protein